MHLNTPFIGYYRCSTIEQGRSGLGLEGQKTTVTNYIRNKGILISEYVEVETGTSKKIRPQLQMALSEAKKKKAILVIAKLDRLSRNVNFVSSLMEAGVEFIACDMPTANNFTIHIFAALAEQEAQLISQRTKTALAELKKKGVKLGSPDNLSHEARTKGLSTRKSNSINNPNNIKAKAMSRLLFEKGLTLSKIAYELNLLGYETRRGLKFRPETIKRLLSS